MRTTHIALGPGVLTTDHSASSYGQPVFVPDANPDTILNAAFEPLEDFDSNAGRLAEAGVGAALDAMRGPGRPSLGDKARSVRIQTAVTPAEAEAVEQARGAESRSDWIRRAILARLDQ